MQFNVSVYNVDIEDATINIVISMAGFDSKYSEILREKDMDLNDFQEYWFYFFHSSCGHTLSVTVEDKEKLKEFFGINILESFF